MTIMHSLYREAGHVEVNDATCKHCGLCAVICPSEVFSLVDGRIRLRDDSLFGCIACGHCMMLCPTGSIRVSGRGLAPEDLLPLPPLEERATAEQLTALMLARRSIRHFKDEEVDPALLARVIQMASTAPMGVPPWDIGCTIIRGRAQVQALAAEIIQGYEGFLRMFKLWVLALLRPIMGRTKYEFFKHFIRPLAQMYVQNHRAGRDVLFHNAPAVMLFHHSPYTDVVDTTIACTYAMLAAESLGLGTTIIGGAPPVLKRNKALCRRLGIPKANAPQPSP